MKMNVYEIEHPCLKEKQPVLAESLESALQTFKKFYENDYDVKYTEPTSVKLIMSDIITIN